MEVLRHKLLAQVQAKVLRREWGCAEGWFSAVEARAWATELAVDPCAPNTWYDMRLLAGYVDMRRKGGIVGAALLRLKKLVDCGQL